MNYGKRSSLRRSEDSSIMDDNEAEEKDDSKRKSRNLSEKKRRDQFNMLINELCSMVSTNNRKMDKSTVLKSTIAFLKTHNEIAVRSQAHEIQEDWKPSFLSNEEFTHLMLEALDGFIIVFSSCGRILYASESITSLLGQLPDDLLNLTVYDLVHEEDKNELYNLLTNYPLSSEVSTYDNEKDRQIKFFCHVKRGPLDLQEPETYEPVQFIGNFKPWGNQDGLDSYEVEDDNSNKYSPFSTVTSETRTVFVATARLQTPQLIQEMSLVDVSKSEFTSRHSLEWKFLFLDHRAPPIIGYLPFEVLGTSGYDYLHAEDLDKIVACHEALMQTGEGTSCYYRFLTKGQQWIWLQTRYYITYHQWNSKPEFIVCTHTIISHVEVIAHLKKEKSKPTLKEEASSSSIKSPVHSSQTQQPSSARSPPSSVVSQSCLSPAWSNKSSTASQDNQPLTGSSLEESPGIGSVKLTHLTQLGQCHNLSGSPAPSVATVGSVGSQHSPMQQPPTSQVVPQMFLAPAPPYTQSAANVVPVATYQSSNELATPIVMAASDGELFTPQLQMTSAQTQLQEHLRRKHQALQEQIIRQQEELRRVHQQLMLTQLSPSIVKVTPVPYNQLPVSSSAPSSSSLQTLVSHPMFSTATTATTCFTTPVLGSQPLVAATNLMIDPQQTQILFSSNYSSSSPADQSGDRGNNNISSQ